MRTTYPVIELCMVDKSVVTAFSNYVNSTFLCINKEKSAKIRTLAAHGNRQKTFKIAVTRRRAEIMIREFYPFWSSHRREQSNAIFRKCGLSPLPVEETNNVEVEWLAGLLDAEGCFKVHKTRGYTYPQIQLEMTCKDIVSSVSIWLNKNVAKAQYSGKGRPEQAISVLTRKAPTSRRKDSYSVQINGRRACNLATMLLPYMKNKSKMSDVGRLLSLPCSI